MKEKNDYTVMVLGGRIGDKIHIIDYRRLRVMGNLEKLDAMKELLHDWSIIGRQADGLWFPTYNTCDIWSEAVQYQASLEADFKRVCLNEENLYNLIWHPVKDSEQTSLLVSVESWACLKTERLSLIGIVILQTCSKN